MRTRWRLGSETFGDLIFECETLWPVRRPFPQTEQVRGMVFPPRIFKKLRASSTRKSPLQEDSRGFGDEGEEMAAAYLARHGFKIVERNVQYKTGEIDIIARRGKELHFFEVKTRSDPCLAGPLEAITEKKKGRIRRTAQIYLNDHRNNFNDKQLPPCFFSVIGIDFAGGESRIECILDAFI